MTSERLHAESDFGQCPNRPKFDLILLLVNSSLMRIDAKYDFLDAV